MRIARITLLICMMTVLSCSKVNTVVDTDKIPDLRDISVKITLPSDCYDYAGNCKVSYTTDAGDKGTVPVLYDGTFIAAVSKEAKTISATMGPSSISSKQVKTYLSSDDDFRAGMSASAEAAPIGPNEAELTFKPTSSGVLVNILDTKHFARGEKILSVSYIPEGTVVSPITVNWLSNDPALSLKVGDSLNPATVGMVFNASGTKVNGKFKITTDRKDTDGNDVTTYIFTVNALQFIEGGITEINIDMCAPDNQPIRRVGILGDSISTFLGWIDSSYSAYYPTSDSIEKGGTGTVQSVEKTYWWKIINEKMKYGVLDVNNSYSGTKVVTENGVKGFVDRAYRFNDPDIIIIHGGTNDKNKASTIGEYDFDLPIGQLDENCYRSAYVKLVKMLQTRFEGVEIIVLVGDMLTTQYAQSNIAIAEHFGLPCVDFTKGGTITNDTVNIPKSTGSHPDAKGMQYMADRIAEVCADYLP